MIAFSASPIVTWPLELVLDELELDDEELEDWLDELLWISVAPGTSVRVVVVVLVCAAAMPVSARPAQSVNARMRIVPPFCLSAERAAFPSPEQAMRRGKHKR